MEQRDGKFYERCFLCNSQYQNGPHVYEGVGLPLYGSGIAICKGCHAGNWDGFSAQGKKAAKLRRHCVENGIKVPEVNDKGNLPRGSTADGYKFDH